jgi:hypothetical protein
MQPGIGEQFKVVGKFSGDTAQSDDAPIVCFHDACLFPVYVTGSVTLQK